MNEMTYGIPSGLIALSLLLTLTVAMEVGFRVGRVALARGATASAASQEHINGIQTSILGILALLLAFTLSLALQRFDSRSAAVVDEANAIGTAYLRAQLLRPPMRADVQALLRDYLDLRVEASNRSIVEGDRHAGPLADATRLHGALWAQAVRAAEVDPNPVSSGLFIQSLNELFDSFSRRDAGLNRHVPEVVLLLLFGAFLMAGGIVGYACGAAGHRPSLVSYVMVALIVVLVFIVIDLDRPRRGLILVSQKSLLDLQASLRATDAEAVPALRGPAERVPLPPFPASGMQR